MSGLRCPTFASIFTVRIRPRHPRPLLYLSWVRFHVPSFDFIIRCRAARVSTHSIVSTGARGSLPSQFSADVQDGEVGTAHRHEARKRDPAVRLGSLPLSSLNDVVANLLSTSRPPISQKSTPPLHRAVMQVEALRLNLSAALLGWLRMTGLRRSMRRFHRTGPNVSIVPPL